MRKTLANRFWEKVAFLGADPDDCWEWRAARSKNSYGYGVIWVNNKQTSAHRVSWKFANGPIPQGMCVLHYCDNPACVNPAHLFLGTNADNTQDMVNKGRDAKAFGEENGRAKLAGQDIHGIRKMLAKKIPQRVIAKKYGVSRRAISMINTGKTWGWLL